MTMSYRAARGKLIGMGQDSTLTVKTVTTVVVENELVKAENGPEIIMATTFKDLDIQVNSIYLIMWFFTLQSPVLVYHNVIFQVLVGHNIPLLSKGLVIVLHLKIVHILFDHFLNRVFNPPAPCNQFYSRCIPNNNR